MSLKHFREDINFWCFDGSWLWPMGRNWSLHSLLVNVYLIQFIEDNNMLASNHLSDLYDIAFFKLDTVCYYRAKKTHTNTAFLEGFFSVTYLTILTALNLTNLWTCLSSSIACITKSDERILIYYAIIKHTVKQTATWKLSAGLQEFASSKILFPEWTTHLE